MPLFYNSTLTKYWLINAPVLEIAKFCEDYGYEIIINGNNYIIQRRMLGR